MEQETRNKLQQATQQIRRLLEEEFSEQLEGTFDILASGKILASAGKHLDARQRLTRRKLVDAIEHIKAGGKKPQESVEEYTREAAFTFLNRFVALRMLESRGLLQECVSKGDQSSGFREYTGLAPGLASLPDGGYRLYLECLFDELSVEVKVLFDRRDSASLLWPRRGALTELLDILGQGDLSGVWGEDETIGWVYQYFNSGEERKKMRDESQAPRNSRELAVRNQFFTPRYVVEFLTDNTLGRIWHEMQKGTTRLADECRYLVRRPMEFFLPDPAACGLLDTYVGRKEMHTFWRSGNAADIPENPSTAVVMDWVTRLANDLASGNGFENCLRQLGDTHDAVLERLFFSKQANAKVQTESLKAEHPVVLMHGIWRVGVEITRSSCSDMSEPILTHPEAGPCWTELRSRLVNPPDNLTQAELLNQPVFVPHRAKKDPRDLKILDPACGSGHFLLYAFDLLLWIYEEAWRDTAGPRSEVTGKRLSEDYPDLQQLHAALPGLILANNLHGIDIDPRAAQIAALALWMRGQRAFNAFNIFGIVRPLIARSNIVCAEPMPGESAYLDEFIEEHLSQTAENRFLASLVRKVFESMKLAGDAGSLLKVEEDIADEVAKAKKQWLNRPTMKQKVFFEDGPKMVQKELDLTRGITDASFWEEAEQNIYEALRAYSEQAERSGGFQRRLFAADAARSFAFIDLCRERYDVAIMNPPFGEASEVSRDYLYRALPETARDLFAGFVKRFSVKLANGGRLGALTNRTAFFSDFLAGWRSEVLAGRSTALRLMADLGYGVLDAVVEAAAYVCERSANLEAVFINALSEVRKDQRLDHAVRSLAQGTEDQRVYTQNVSLFSRIPDMRFAYHLRDRWISLIADSDEHPLFVSRAGLTSGDDFRFLRLYWELPEDLIASRWKWLAKGGDFGRYVTNLHLKIDWTAEQFLSRTRNSELYGLRGATYTERTTSNLSARVLNSGCCFSGPGPGVIPRNESHAHLVLAFLNSFVATYCLEALIGGGDFSVKGSAARHLEPGYINHLPALPTTVAATESFHNAMEELVRSLCSLIVDESHPLYCGQFISVGNASLGNICESLQRSSFKTLGRCYEIIRESESRIAQLLGIADETAAEAFSDTGWPWPDGACSNAIHRLSQFNDLDAENTDRIPSRLAKREVRFRFQNKLAHYLHAGIEAVSHELEVSPEEVCTYLAKHATAPNELQKRVAKTLVSLAFGIVVGHWPETAIGSKLAVYEAESVFDELPGRQPARTMVHGNRGITVCDVGHPDDASTLIKNLLVRKLGKHSVDILGEISEALFSGSEAGDLGTWLRRQFFEEHLKDYSKSRRKAPIYWPIATPSASYSVWLYYHLLTRDTFFQVLNEYVKPKRDHERQKLERLRSEGGAEPARSQRKEIEVQEKFVAELAAMAEEIERIAPLWNPDLNDGVIINFAPLWRLVPQNKSWQKECKGCWDKLIVGDFDWAHVAMHLWPERVVPKCVDDASLAIAHGLEMILWEQDDIKRFYPKAKPEGGWQPVIDRLVQERTSPAVKAALKSLLEAPIASATTKSTRKR